VTVSWNSASGATSYSLYRNVSSGSYSQLASGITSTTYTDSAVTGGRQYCYEVTAVNAAGESGPSNSNCAVPTPGNVSITSVSPNAGSAGQTLPSIIILGQNLQGPTCTINNSNISVSCVVDPNAPTGTQIDASVTIGSAVTGSYTLTVTTSGGSANATFTVAPNITISDCANRVDGGSIGQGKDQYYFQNCLEDTAAGNSSLGIAAGTILEIPSGTYNLVQCLSGNPLYCGNQSDHSNTWSVYVPSGAYMRIDSGATISASGTYQCQTVMFRLAGSNITIAGAGEAVSTLTMANASSNSVGCESSHVLDIDGADNNSGDLATNIAISGLTASHAIGDNLYITRANGITVSGAIFDQGYRSSSSITSFVNNIYISAVTFSGANQNGVNCSNGPTPCPQRGLDIEPNSYSGDYVQNINIVGSSFNNNVGDGIFFSLEELTQTTNPVSINIYGASTNSNGRYGYGAKNNEDGGNTGGTISVNSSTSTSDGQECAAARSGWVSAGESLIFNNLTCINPNAKDPGGDDFNRNPAPAVADINGGNAHTQLMGNIHFYTVNICVNVQSQCPLANGASSNTGHAFAFLDQDCSSACGFQTNTTAGQGTDFSPGTLSGSVLPGGWFQATPQTSATLCSSDVNNSVCQ
jgi:hypothetical protein